MQSVLVVKFYYSYNFSTTTCFRTSLTFRGLLLKIKRGEKSIANESQDAIQFCARTQVANVIFRRNLWLKHWGVDHILKSSLFMEKFSGRLLGRRRFGFMYT